MRYFQPHEFACKCGCGGGFRNMNEAFLTMLDEARDVAGVPFALNSAYRCPAHNAAVGSSSYNHVSGRAVDIRCADGPTRIRMVEALMSVGFRRIGIRRDFIHADTMDRQEQGSPRSMWLY